jgi:hypothetical protein
MQYVSIIRFILQLVVTFYGFAFGRDFSPARYTKNRTQIYAESVKRSTKPRMTHTPPRLAFFSLSDRLILEVFGLVCCKKTQMRRSLRD